MEVVAVHPFASVIVIEYDPEGALLTEYEPLLAFISFPEGSPEIGPIQLMLYGEVPPEAVPESVPVDPPLHNTGVIEAVATNAVGSVKEIGKV
jgi:hypothetical protein